jgi:hypothetical protein
MCETVCRGHLGDSAHLEATCPICVIAPEVAKMPIGAKLFEGIKAASALAVLRELLECIKVKASNDYRTHDLRRGHARDLQLGGASLYEILSAGEWRSPAFLKVGMQAWMLCVQCGRQFVCSIWI